MSDVLVHSRKRKGLPHMSSVNYLNMFVSNVTANITYSSTAILFFLFESSTHTDNSIPKFYHFSLPSF